MFCIYCNHFKGRSRIYQGITRGYEKADVYCSPQDLEIARGLREVNQGAGGAEKVEKTLK